MRKYRKPYRLKKKRPFLKNRFFWFGVLILIILGGIFYLIFLHPLFQVKEIEIVDNQKVTKENLEALVIAKINKKIFFFPTKSIFLINLNEINKSILEKFPEIDRVSSKRKFPNALFIQIKEREAIAIFCQATDCFLVDREGIVFESTQPKKDLVLLKREKEEKINLRESVIKKEDLLQILEIEARLKNELKILTEEILVISEEKIVVRTSEVWQIYFNLNENLDWQLTKLRAVLENEIPPEKRKSLEYIDVRFGNFAPYKYHD